MPEYHAPFRCELLTPSGSAFASQVVFAVVPAADGQLGILGQRAPVVAAMGAGRLAVQLPDGQTREYFVAGGFAQMRDNALTVLAERCVPLERLDPSAAWDEIEKAKSLPADTRAAAARRAEAISVARTKLRVAQEYRRRGRGDGDSVVPTRP